MKTKKWLAASTALLAITSISHSASAASTIDVSTTQIEFVEPDDIGEGAAVGFTHRYKNVIPSLAKPIDARVTITGINNLESAANESASAATPDNKVEKLDDYTSNVENNKAIGLDVDIFGVNETPALGSVIMRVEFLESGSLVPVVLKNLSMYVTDIDSEQFLQVSGITSYRMTSSTKLTAKSNSIDSAIPLGSYKFLAPNISSSSSDPDATDFWAEVTVDEASFIDFTIGAEQAGGASFNLVFKKADWAGATAVDTTPPAPSYTITYDGNASTSGSAPASQSGSSYITIPGNSGSLSRPGYEFAGWNSAADGTGLVVDPASAFRPTSNITLYAQWKVASATTTTTTTAPATTTTVAEEVVTDVKTTDAGPLPDAGLSSTSLLFAGFLAVLIGLRIRRGATSHT